MEETEVEEGKWKEGARGAPRLVAMIPVPSWNTCSSNGPWVCTAEMSFTIELYICNITWPVLPAWFLYKQNFYETLSIVAIFYTSL